MLFYVCSEALVNAVKHASASRVSIALRGDHDFLVVTVADDGCGGANSDGSGLRGLSDRLASRGRPARGGQPTRNRHDGNRHSASSCDLAPRLDSERQDVKRVRVAEPQGVAVQSPGQPVVLVRPALIRAG